MRPWTGGTTGRPERPVVQAWLDAGASPEDIDLVSVSTAIDPNRPNDPPEAWLAYEGWTPPVMVDPTGAVADAYGMSTFPSFVFGTPTAPSAPGRPER